MAGQCTSDSLQYPNTFAESATPESYDAIFKSIITHLLRKNDTDE